MEIEESDANANFCYIGETSTLMWSNHLTIFYISYLLESDHSILFSLFRIYVTLIESLQFIILEGMWMKKQMQLSKEIMKTSISWSFYYMYMI